MSRIDQYRDVPSLAPTVLVTRGEGIASLAAKSAAARNADSAQDQRSIPAGAVAAS